MHTIFN